MCTSPLKCFTNSRFLSSNKVTNLINWLPCGFCVDCIRKKKSEYALRAYYEAKDCFDHNGFVLFDSLTYDDDNLKYFHDIYHRALYNSWDFKSFSRDDVNKFFKRLRIKLSRAGYDHKGKLRYFLTSEYGSSDDYIDDRGRLRHATERPHYHILFFVTFDIHPVVLSRFISEAWNLGRTDGVPYKSYYYVLNERVSRSKGSNTLKLVRYVSKYITKDLYTYKKLYKRVYMSYTLENPNWFKSYSQRLAFRRFKNQVMPFHLQSIGFGLSALRYEDSQYMDDHLSIRMPINSVGVITSVSMPLYYRRKLYYSCVYVFGRLTWIMNDKYKSILVNRLDRQIVDFRNKLFSWNNSLGIELSTTIAEYHFVWRYRLIPYEMLFWNYKDIYLDQLSSFKFGFYDKKIGCCRLNDGVYINHGSERDSYKFGRHIRTGYFGNDIRAWSYSEFLNLPPDGLVYIDQKLERFSGFDDILDNYFDWYKCIGYNLVNQQYEIDKQRYRYKLLGLLKC